MLSASSIFAEKNSLFNISGHRRREMRVSMIADAFKEGLVGKCVTTLIGSKQSKLLQMVFNQHEYEISKLCFSRTLVEQVCLIYKQNKWVGVEVNHFPPRRWWVNWADGWSLIDSVPNCGLFHFRSFLLPSSCACAYGHACPARPPEFLIESNEAE